MPPEQTTRAISATNEENHQRHNGCIEAVFREGKRHCVALAELCYARRGSCARIGKLALGRIDT